MQKLTLKINPAYKIENDGFARVTVFKSEKIIAKVMSLLCAFQVIFQELDADGVEVDYLDICDFEEIEDAK